MGNLMAQCSLPPSGWWCSLEEGHDGPCPTRSTQRFVTLTEQEAFALYHSVMGNRFDADDIDSALKHIEPLYYASLDSA